MHHYRQGEEIVSKQFQSSKYNDTMYLILLFVLN